MPSASPLRAAGTAFSQENCYALLKVLADEIGPRPMGSPAEHRALEFAVAKFREYGCQESSLMPFTVAEGVNTASGIAVGVLRGRTGRIILIGGHIDSSGPDVPGANDDGSGASVVLEAARVLAQRSHESTIVFCCWGGEEEGLCGSRYFADHFPQIDSVMLMLQIDMADGNSYLGIDPDGPHGISAPRWLVSAAYREFYGRLGAAGLDYPTESRTINEALGFSGSDHIPFLEKGIPSLDFTSDVSYPIHTPQDDLAHFNPAGLKRAGDLVVSLVDRFDGGVPSRSTERYWLLQWGSLVFFFVHPVIWMFVAVAGIVSIVALIVARRRREVDGRARKIRWSALKVFLFTFLVQLCIWVSPGVVGLIKGERSPWVNNIPGFTVLGILAGLIGLWCVIRLVPRFRLTADPFAFHVRAWLLLFCWTALFALLDIELAVYPAWALLFYSAAMVVSRPWVKLACLLIAPLLLLRLFFFEEVSLVQRSLASMVLDSFMKVAVYNLLFTLMFSAAAYPFALAFAGVYRDSGVDLLWLKRFATARGLRVLLGLALVTVIVLVVRPAYDGWWESAVRVDEKVPYGSETIRLSLRSGEYLEHLRLKYAGGDTVLSSRTNVDSILLPAQSSLPLCRVTTRTEKVDSAGQADSAGLTRRVVEIRSAIRPLRINVRYRSPDTIACTSPWAARVGSRLNRLSPNIRVFSWYSYPDSVLVIPVTFRLKEDQRIAESIEVVFDRLVVPVTLEREWTYFTKRTIVTREDTFGVPRETEHFADAGGGR